MQSASGRLLLGTSWLMFGRSAVTVFIVLSGYCLMLPVVQSPRRELRSTFQQFITRRAWRILPPYYGALAVSIVLILMVPSLDDPSIGEWHKSFPAISAGSGGVAPGPAAQLRARLSVRNRPPSLEHRHGVANLLSVPVAGFDRQERRGLPNCHYLGAHHRRLEHRARELLAGPQPVAAAVRRAVRLRDGVCRLELSAGGRRASPRQPPLGASRDGAAAAGGGVEPRVRRPTASRCRTC